MKNKELLRRAHALAPKAVEGLTLRQFHGKFRLPIARESASGAPRKRKARAKRMQPPTASAAAASPATPSRPVRGPATPDVPAAVRAAARDVFRRFAVELSSADDRASIVRAVARIDAYVDEILEKLYSPPEPPKRRSRRRVERVVEPEAQAPVAAEQPRPPLDMRRRRRPRSEIRAAAEAASERAETPPSTTSGPEQQPDQPNQTGEAAKEAPPKPAQLLPGLIHDLEEFRKRQLDAATRGRRKMQ